jgi:hypothetical protein
MIFNDLKVIISVANVNVILLSEMDNIVKLDEWLLLFFFCRNSLSVYVKSIVLTLRKSIKITRLCLVATLITNTEETHSIGIDICNVSTEK